jgi:hypothetical protein
MPHGPLSPDCPHGYIPECQKLNGFGKVVTPNHNVHTDGLPTRSMVRATSPSTKATSSLSEQNTLGHSPTSFIIECFEWKTLFPYS